MHVNAVKCTKFVNALMRFSLFFSSKIIKIWIFLLLPRMTLKHVVGGTFFFQVLSRCIFPLFFYIYRFPIKIIGAFLILINCSLRQFRTSARKWFAIVDALVVSFLFRNPIFCWLIKHLLCQKIDSIFLLINDGNFLFLMFLVSVLSWTVKNVIVYETSGSELI